ncbi:MAG TPA: peptidoglycan DD-metalloendopeptidase family protein [Trueperaceae bacterium]|nr:peptidoglycan DD-metalloendopeptidase family protein [Trueperaceae bacterium]
MALVVACMPGARADRAYVVAPGDTLYALAARFGTTVAELRSANGLTGDLLRPGETLRVPTGDGGGYGIAIAEPGETLADLAARLGRTVPTLASANPVLARDGVRAGATVSVPPAEGITVVVARGDTLASLAGRAGVSAGQLARVNGMDPSAPLQVGQDVLFPAGAVPVHDPAAAHDPAPAAAAAIASPAASPAATKPSASTAAAGSGRPAGGGPGAPGSADIQAASTPRARLEAMQDAALLAAVLRLPKVRLSTDTFIAPVHGRLSSAFGWRALSVDGNHFHAGIDLAVPMGTPIHAARDGVVAEARWDGTYGNVVFLDHGDGSQTRYAHMSRIAVRVGDEVRQGDVLGFAGSTGWSTGPHVHFELRFDGRAVNPLDYLRGGIGP